MTATTLRTTKHSNPTRVHLPCLLGYALLAAGFCQPTLASESESITRILNTARQFAATMIKAADGQEVEIEIGQLDSRLQLTRCAHPPTAQFAPGARTEGQTTINVRCSDPVSWSVFIPARIERHAEVLVVDRPIARQQVIQPEDIRLERQAVSGLTNGYFTEPEAVVGMTSRRHLVPGQVLTSAHVTQRRVVKRGQEVTLFSARPGLVVRMKGIALEDGGEGARIRVRNSSSKRVVEGYVEPSGAVRVGL
ncbi:flagellar basal body P-ring formation chaperone FlgA [Thermochromatium tepidum]|uniref:Flagella basal body P-ring formation protein FlgA n=1 Tax=Thermochromatium tepidum ATCC 43061 TaxID=316276 RepID=A0A6I6E245_THETI|nr:flagellar basal body P-ring formation chaperone FlgA [Thermochromatium tepidum]QGU33005.1 flagellar basal body P-ring formation protein FlgA [Thermochromatium tepidum ATCC 43061]